MRSPRIQILTITPHPLFKPPIILHYLQNAAQFFLVLNKRPFQICLLSLVLDVPHWTNFSSMKILRDSCFCCYSRLPIFLCCWNGSRFVWQNISFIKKQLKYHLFSQLISFPYFHSSPTSTFLCPKLVTNPLFSLCTTYSYHKHIMLYCHNLFMH